MPIYEYYCASCDQSFDVMQKISDPPLAACESCGSQMQKQLTAAAFHLKGGGWYKDGYASTKGDSGAAAKNDGGSSTSDASSKSSDGSKSSGASSDAKSSSSAASSSD